MLVWKEEESLDSPPERVWKTVIVKSLDGDDEYGDGESVVLGLEESDEDFGRRQRLIFFGYEL